MENWAVYQLELYQVKENRMEEYKGRESNNDPCGEGSQRGARVRKGGNLSHTQDDCRRDDPTVGCFNGRKRCSLEKAARL